MDSENEVIEIDPDQLDIIYEKENWKPKIEYIRAYARQLGFDVENDPPELLNIAEKYLTAEIPDEYYRAFHLTNYTLFYVNAITNEIETNTDIEELAREEYLRAKERLKNEENKVKVIPRTKIAPIGSKKALKDSKNEKEKEILKKSQKSFKEDKKEKKGIGDKLFKKEIEKSKNRISDEIKPNDKEIKLDFDEDGYVAQELAYFQKKIDIEKNKNIKSNNNIINNKDSENNVLNLRDSSNIIRNFDNDSSDEDKKSVNAIPSKKNMNLKKERSVENLKISNEIENPGTIEGNKYNSINPKYERSNKKRQNLRYDRKSFDRMNEEIHFKKQNEGKNVEISSEENDDNKNKNIILNISDESRDSNNLEEMKNNYKEKIIKDFKTFKENIKNRYIKNKENFLEDIDNDLDFRNKNKINELKEENNEILSSYENELKNKMNLELEIFKNNLINDYNKDSEDVENDDKDYDKLNLELKCKKLKSEINIQKEKHNIKKEILEQKKKNEINETLKALSQNHKLNKSNLEKQTKNKIESLNNEFQKKFSLYQIEYEMKNKNTLFNEVNMEKEINILQKDLIRYEKELKEEFEENTNQLRKEYDNKLIKDIEIFKETIKKENSEEKINKENKDLERNYFDELNEIKVNNKYEIKHMEETIKKLFEKISNSFDEIKNKSKNEINKIISDVVKKIKEIIRNENFEDIKDSLINEFLSDLISKKILMLNKHSSYVDMIEEEYKQNTILIEYFIEIIRMITGLINEDNKKIKNININKENANEYLINEILQRINDLMEDFRYKYEDEQNNRLYPLLYDTLQKIKNLKFDDENNYNIGFISNRGNPLINSNPNITNANYLNYINNSQMNDSNYNLNNNNNLFSNRTNNNTILNNNQINSSRQMQLNNSSSYINPLTQRNNYYLNQNRTLNPSSPRNNSNIFPIKEDIESNLSSANLNYINIPQLPNEIVNNLNSENIQNYKLVMNFLINEYNQISEEQNNYFNRNNANQKLNLLKESGEFAKYNHIFEQISKQENDRNKQYLKDIESKKKVLELIKNNYEESFNFIIKYYNNSNIVNNKLRVLITHIEDYNKHFNSKRRNFTNNNNSTNDNLQNLLNNTFQIERRNYNQQNILNNTFINNFGQDNSRFNNTYNSFRNYY